MKHRVGFLFFLCALAFTAKAQLIQVPNALDSDIRRWAWNDTTATQYRIKFQRNYNVAFILRLEVTRVRGGKFKIKGAEQIEKGKSKKSTLILDSLELFTIPGLKNTRHIKFINIPIFMNFVDESIEKYNLMRRQPVLAIGKTPAESKDSDMPNSHLLNFIYFFDELFCRTLSRNEITTAPIWFLADIRT